MAAFHAEMIDTKGRQSSRPGRPGLTRNGVRAITSCRPVAFPLRSGESRQSPAVPESRLFRAGGHYREETSSPACQLRGYGSFRIRRVTRDALVRALGQEREPGLVRSSPRSCCAGEPRHSRVRLSLSAPLPRLPDRRVSGISGTFHCTTPCPTRPRCTSALRHGR
jgi:hypothetical protein